MRQPERGRDSDAWIPSLAVRENRHLRQAADPERGREERSHPTQQGRSVFLPFLIVNN